MKGGVMKKESYAVVKIVIGLVVAMTLISCASAPKQSGFLHGYYDKMEPGPKDGARMRWHKPGVDFGKYNKIMLDHVVYFFAEDSEYKGIDPEVLTGLTAEFEKEIMDAYKDRIPFVAEPGPDVVVLKIALTGLKQSSPVISGITTVVPIGLGVSAIRKGTTGSWTGSGATSAELIAIDSVSNEVIAVAEDTQTAGFTERFTKYGSAGEAFKYWAGRLRAFTESMKQH